MGFLHFWNSVFTATRCIDYADFVLLITKRTFQSPPPSLVLKDERLPTTPPPPNIDCRLSFMLLSTSTSELTLRSGTQEDTFSPNLLTVRTPLPAPPMSTQAAKAV